MTARKIAIALVLFGVAVYFIVTWGIERYRKRGEEPPAEPEPEPDEMGPARFATTTSIEGFGLVESPLAWTTAVASADVPLGAVVSVGQFGDDASVLSVRQRGDVVASEMTIVAHRDDLAPTAVVAYVDDAADEFTLENVTLLVRLTEPSTQ